MHVRAYAPLAGAVLILAAVVSVGPDAGASVSEAIRFDALVKSADAVAVLTPLASYAAWENGRIYTYTRLHVDQTVASRAALGSETVVRTRGGIVGDVGQRVDGEPSFDVGRATLVFLAETAPGTHVVTGRAQGQYSVDGAPEHGRVIHASTRAGVITLPRDAARRRAMQSEIVPLARDVLHEQPLAEAAAQIRLVWSQTHAP